MQIGGPTSSMGFFRTEVGSGNLDFESQANILYQPLEHRPRGLARSLPFWRLRDGDPVRRGKSAFPGVLPLVKSEYLLLWPSLSTSSQTGALPTLHPER